MEHSIWREIVESAREQLRNGQEEDALAAIERLRRKLLIQAPYELSKSTHSAETLWLKGVLLIRCGRSDESPTTFRQLARLHLQRMSVIPDAWLLGCDICVAKDQDEVLSWWALANRLSEGPGESARPHTLEALVATIADAAAAVAQVPGGSSRG